MLKNSYSIILKKIVFLLLILTKEEPTIGFPVLGSNCRSGKTNVVLLEE